MRTSEHVNELVGALAKARMHFKPIVEKQTNPAFNSKYADQSAIIAAVYEALAHEGLILTGGTEPLEDGGILVTSRLTHTSEQFIENALRLQRTDWEGVGRGSNRLQQLGGAITYAWRYTTGPLLGVTAESDDHDGQTDEPDKKPQPNTASRPQHRDPKPRMAESESDKTSKGATGEAAQEAILAKIRAEYRRTNTLDPETKTARRALFKEAFAIEQMEELTTQSDEALEVGYLRLQALLHPPAVQGESSAAEPTESHQAGSDEGYATPDQIAELAQLAQEVGDDAAADVQEMLEHHPEGLVVDIYAIVMERLRARQQSQLAAPLATTNGTEAQREAPKADRASREQPDAKDETVDRVAATFAEWGAWVKRADTVGISRQDQRTWRRKGYTVAMAEVARLEQARQVREG